MALLFCSESGNPAGKNFASLGDKLPQQIDIFVVDRLFRLERRYATTIIAHGNLWVSGQWSVVRLRDYGQEVTSLLLTADLNNQS